MLALKRIVTVAVMVYLLLALLFILSPAVRATLESTSDALSNIDQERQFFYVMFVIGAIVLALHLVTENLDSSLLRRTVSQNEGKINELKAKLYDHQQHTDAPVLTTRPTEPSYPATDPSQPGAYPPDQPLA